MYVCVVGGWVGGRGGSVHRFNLCCLTTRIRRNSFIAVIVAHDVPMMV